MREYGMPARIRTDNGAPFAGTGLLGLSKLSLGWVTAPNQLWCMDFKGYFSTGDGARCDPFTITDAHSRYLTGKWFRVRSRAPFLPLWTSQTGSLQYVAERAGRWPIYACIQLFQSCLELPRSPRGVLAP